MPRGQHRNYHVEGEKPKRLESPPRKKLYSSEDEATMAGAPSEVKVKSEEPAPFPPSHHDPGAESHEDMALEDILPPPSLPAPAPVPQFSLPELGAIDIKFRLYQGIITTQASELAELRRQSTEEIAFLQAEVKKLSTDKTSLIRQKQALVEQRDGLKRENGGLKAANQMSIKLRLADNKRFEKKIGELESRVSGLPEKVAELQSDREYLKQSVLAACDHRVAWTEKMKENHLAAAQEWAEHEETSRMEEAATKEMLGKMK